MRRFLIPIFLCLAGLAYADPLSLGPDMAGRGGDARMLTQGITSCVAHQWYNAFTRGTGFACAQPATGDISGAGTAITANTGTSGATLPFLNGTNTWSGVQTFGEVLGTVTSQSGTGSSAYTFVAGDCGTLILATGASAATYTVPNSLPVACHIAVSQETSGGQVTIAAGTGATFNANPHSYTKTFGQYAIIGISVKSNSGGSSAVFTLVGDGA